MTNCRSRTGPSTILILFLSIVFIFVAAISSAHSASTCLPKPYQGLETSCLQETRFDRLLSVAFGDGAKPRQIAVIAAVSKYPALPQGLQLPAAATDIGMLQRVLIDKLGFDEVITLQNEDFSFQNLRYIFENYLPDLLQANPKSRVLFAYSGHGSDFDDQGFLYFSNTATINAGSYAELTDALNLTTLKVMMAPTMRNAQQFLALINSCNGGYFLNVGASFGASALDEKGAHGITAGGAKDAVHAYSNVGTGKGSVFFEMVVAALSGQEVTVGGRKFENPAKDDGILTATRLEDFLATTIGIIENYKLSPRMGALTGTGPGNQGEFFFVTNYDLARAALSSRFPKSAERVFGNSPPDAGPVGLYAKLNIPSGVLLRAEMFSSIEPPDRSTSDRGQFPSSFPDDVRSACLELPLKENERLTWRHLRSDCKR
jgi:hypothetical protein